LTKPIPIAPKPRPTITVRRPANNPITASHQRRLAGGGVDPLPEISIGETIELTNSAPDRAKSLNHQQITSSKKLNAFADEKRALLSRKLGVLLVNRFVFWLGGSDQ
jgi:hypothetical protein